MRVECKSDVPRHKTEATHRTGTSKTWRVQVWVIETADNTRATALLISDHRSQFSGNGDSHRSPQDEPKTAIGDEVAVARALRHLADSLLARAGSDIEASTGIDALRAPHVGQRFETPQELYAVSTAARRSARGHRTARATMANRLPTAEMATAEAGDVRSAR